MHRGEHITAVCAFLPGILLSPGADPSFVRLKLVQFFLREVGWGGGGERGREGKRGEPALLEKE